MKRIFTLLFLLTSVLSFGQNLNNYKYIVVPQRFDFQKSAGQFELNNVVKLMFEKYDFKVLMEGTQYPDDVALDRCKTLYSDITESGLIHTNLTISIKDCSGSVLYTSAAGRSKLKDRRKAYYEALREASHSLSGLNYHYAEDKSSATKTITNKEEVTIYVPSSVKQENNPNLLTAKSTAYGYELVDSKGRQVLKMYKTSQPDSYSAKMEDVNGVVFKKGNDWFFEYYLNDKPVSQKLDIRF